MSATDITNEPKGLFSIERVVALATPIFAVAGGYVFSLVGKWIPGINLPKGDFVDLFIAGGTLATTASLTWLFGRQKFVNNRTNSALVQTTQEITAQGPSEIRQIEAALEAHETAVIEGVVKRIGASAPLSVGDVAEEVVKRIVTSQPPMAGGGPVA
jgi:hypothetical protein